MGGENYRQNRKAGDIWFDFTMRKKKIYLDTSVISYLRQEDAPKEMRETLDFLEFPSHGEMSRRLMVCEWFVLRTISPLWIFMPRLCCWK